MTSNARDGRPHPGHACDQQTARASCGWKTASTPTSTTVWSALTDPGRLARWLGDVEGDLRLGGEFRARFFASGWEGTGRVEACDPPRRLLVQTRDRTSRTSIAIEVTLASDGDQTILVWEERGLPLDHLAAYGSGIQVHVEDLSAYIGGRGRGDAEVRWGELLPAYQDLAAKVG